MGKDVLDKIFVHKHPAITPESPRTLKFFRIKKRKRSDEPNFEEVVETKRPYACDDLIEVSTWVGHTTSLWIKIHKFDKDMILDSGIIETLADEIRKLKKSKNPPQAVREE